MPTKMKPYYNEIEAARSLAITVDEFRGLVRRYVVDREEDMMNSPITTFHASDIMLLRMFTGRPLAMPAE